MTNKAFSEAVEAVWDRRGKGTGRRDFLMSLDGAARSLAVLGDLSAEVLNGGLRQWRSNRTGEDAEFVLWALGRIGTDEARRVEAMIREVSATDSDDDDDDDDDDEFDEWFDDLDDAFYTVHDALEGQAVRTFAPGA